MIFLQGVDTIESVLAIRAKVVEALGNGGQVVSWNVEGTSMSKFGGMPLRDLLYECNEFLKLACPDLFGPPVKRTIPVFL
jgi:hypothetical protein